jgi:hypothetical protein
LTGGELLIRREARFESSGLAAHQVTTRHLGGAYPFLAEGGIGGRGVLIGDDLFGGAFAFDPFELYEQGKLSNPNVIVFGQIGRGKSALVKTYLWRQAAFGRRAWVIDPKGEYGALARQWGVRPVSLRPGGPVRLNPLETTRSPGAALGESVSERTAAQQRSELMGSLAVACLGRNLYPRERVALDLALFSVERVVSTVTLPAVVEALLTPTEESARAIRTDARSLTEDGRDVALELRRLVGGDLAGMFDGPTSEGLDLDGPLVVLDLSSLYDSPALGVLMACATAWLQARLARPGQSDRHTIVVVDEAWAILKNLGVARWLQSSWKLSRAFGVSNMAVLHRVSDLRVVGAVGSEQVGLAEGLLADSETRVLYAQPPGEALAAQELLSLSSTEVELLSRLQRGVALWKVGQHSALVRHRVGDLERDLVDSDSAMRRETA